MDIPQLQAAYSDLDSRVTALENRPVTLESLQADYAALSLRVDALEQSGDEPNVLFFDDFEADVGWKAVRSAAPRTVDAPSRWESYTATLCDHEFIAGAGRNGSAGYRIKMDYPYDQVEIGRLTAPEFPETTTVNMETWMKLSEGFVMGTSTPQPAQFWKMWRLHQSPWTRGNIPPHGINGENNTNFIVGSLNLDFLVHTCAWRDTSINSSNGPQVIYKHRERQNVIPFGTWDAATHRITNTDWVRVNVEYSLGDKDQDNGSIRVWFNGQRQSRFTVQFPAYGGSPPIVDQGLVVNPRSHYGNPPGFNRFSFIDNQACVTKNWTEQHYLYVDSIKLFDGTPKDLAN